MYIILIQLFINLVTPYKVHLRTAFIIAALIIVLVAINLLYPSLVYNYPSEISRTADNVSSTLMAVMTLGCVFLIFKRKLEHQEKILNEHITHLEKSTKDYEKLLDSVKEDFFLISEDLEQNIKYISPSAGDILGYSSIDLYEGFHKIITSVPENKEALARRKELFHNSSKAVYELLFPHPDGTMRTLLVKEYAQFEKAHVHTGFNVIIQDVTMKKEFEYNMRSSLEKEKTLNAQKEAFILTMSHQFRTPLTIIKSSCILAKKKVLPQMSEGQETLKKLLERQDEGFLQLENLLASILAYKALDQHTMIFTPLLGNLNEYLIDIIKPFNIASTTGQIVHYHTNKETCYMDFDGSLLQEAIKKLISNALKYSEKDVHVTLEYWEKRALIIIEDKGMGIPKDNLEHVFEPFFRGHNADNTKGAGLGLSIAHKFIQLHQGSITVKSDVNKGSSFIISLPIEQKDNPYKNSEEATSVV
ncbi:hypothetical protein GCM10023331_40910 [Algivirga pacifica]|uniref:histidine kinase n=2 Tax=Algivirga pacifica TaxID=1162670 RepID=A0ABP9DPZ9_9BACT